MEMLRVKYSKIDVYKQNILTIKFEQNCPCVYILEFFTYFNNDKITCYYTGNWNNKMLKYIVAINIYLSIF